jgi:two-component system, chemotaxis family, CheB/CheR fusion protein
VRFPANTNLSVGELLSRNGALAAQNLQLMATLARLTADASTAMARLTPRQQQVMDLVLAGHPNKNIAADLNISQRTVENHRAAIMSRTGATSLPALVRLSLGAE